MNLKKEIEKSIYFIEKRELHKAYEILNVAIKFVNKQALKSKEDFAARKYWQSIYQPLNEAFSNVLYENKRAYILEKLKEAFKLVK